MPEATDVNRLCDEVVDSELRRSPEFATYAGVHDYDDEVTDHSPAAVEAAIRERFGQARRLETIDPTGLDEDSALDRDLTLAFLRGQIVYEEEVRMSSRTPDEILGSFCWGLFTPSKRTFAPPEVRMRNVISRLEKFPAVAEAARARLTGPSRIPLDIAASSLRDTIPFLENSLPTAFAEVRDQAMQARLRSAIEVAVSEYRRMLVWCEEKKAAATPEFAIGEKAYESYMRQAELIDMPLSEVFEIGQQELNRLSEAFIATCGEIDASATPAEVFEALSKDHPAADELLTYTSSLLEDLRTFCVEREILTFPSEVRCTVEPTPEFFRELTFASMDTPGPFEQNSTEAFYNVTTALPEWDADTTEQHMRSYNRYTLTSTSVHEAYPGHYTQFLHQHLWGSRARKLFGSYSAVEGWAHYVEEMVIEQGLNGGDARFHLGQIQEALLRACRLVVGIGMHTGEMSYEEAVSVFQKKGYLEPVNAVREARRGTVDPFYSSYTLGKLMMLKLREDFMAQNRGTSLKQFHDRFLCIGTPPIPLVRKKMLGEVGRPL